MSNLTVENVYTRHKAKELAKRHFWKLLAMSLILAVIVYAISFGGVMLLNIPASTTVTTTSTTIASAFEAAKNPPAQSASIVAGLLYFLLMHIPASGSTVTTSSTIDSAFAAAKNPTAQEVSIVPVLLYLLVMLLNILVSAGLSLGLTSAMLYVARGGEQLAIGQLFSRMRSCLKGFGLSLWVGLKTFLWALPAYAVMAVFAIFLLSFMDSTATQTNESATLILMLLPVVVLVVVFALVIPAYFRYMLSTYVLADKPDTGVFACVRESKVMMKGHKWQAFKLVVPTVLIMYVMLLLFAIVTSCVGALLADALPVVTAILAILAVLAFFVLMMYYSLRMGLGYCIFYLNRVKENTPEEAAPMEEAAKAAPAE